MTCGPCERGLKISRGPRLGTRTEPDRRAGTPARGLAGSDIPPGLPTVCQCQVQLTPGVPSGGGVPVPCYFDVVDWDGVTGETLGRLYPFSNQPDGFGGAFGVDAPGGFTHPSLTGYRAEFPNEPSDPDGRTSLGVNLPTYWEPRECDASNPIGWILGVYQFELLPVISGGALTGWDFEVLGWAPYNEAGSPLIARYSLAGWNPWQSRSDGVLTLDTVDEGFGDCREAYDTNPAGAAAPSFPTSITLRPGCFDSGCLLQTAPGVFEPVNVNPCRGNLATDDNLSDPGPTVWSTPFTPPESPPACFWSWVDYDHWEQSFSNCGDYPNASCGPPPVCDGPPSGIVFPVDVGCYSTR